MGENAANLVLADRLTNGFYHWEHRGRGWQLWPEAVDIEPPFRPFRGHQIDTAPNTDDGQRPTLLHSIAAGLGLVKRVSPPPAPPPAEDEPQPEAAPDDREIVAWEIVLPADFDASAEDCEAFLLGLSSCRHPASFEVIGTTEKVSICLAADTRDASQVEAQFAAHFPEAVLQQADDPLSAAWQQAEGEALPADFGLSRECMLPLRILEDMKTEPLVGLLAALSSLRDGELGVFQILFAPVRHPWSASIMRAVTFPDGSPFFDGAPEFFKQAKRKVSRPLFAAVTRIAVVGADENRMWDIARAITASLIPFAAPAGNELIPLDNEGHDHDEHLRDVLLRRSRRSGCLLNSEELASLVHLPQGAIRCAKLQRIVKNTKAAPQGLTGGEVVLGNNVHNGESREVTLSADERVRHMHVIGASGTGKSTFLLNLIMQDILAGRGLGVIDPHGDLIDEVIARTPEPRIHDVVLVDPSDDQYPIGFNILSAHSDLEKTLLSSDLVGIFRRFSTSWGDQMGSVLGNAVLAFLESATGGTLSDLRRFLIEPQYRSSFLAGVTDPEVTYYWRKEYPLLSGGKSLAPLLTRLDTFLRPKPIRHMVSQQKNRLDIAAIMDSRKIFLAKLSQGAIGEDNAQLLGSLLVSKFHQLTLGRQAQGEASRTPFTLYCDEFGGYVTPSMAKLLSGARKYKLALVLSHQELRQLTDPDVLSAVITNAHTRICFRLGDSDAKSLSDGFASFSPDDLRNLATGEAIAKVGRATDDFNLATTLLEQPDLKRAEERKAAIQHHTRTTYATPRKEVEEELAKQWESGGEEKGKQAETEPRPVVQPVATESVPKSEPQTPVAKNGEQNERKEEPPIVEVVEQVPVAPKPAKKARRAPVVGDMGKGGKEHKYLQQLLAQWAQGLGYRATIEMPTPEGGSIDVVLEKEGRRIACEISVTSTVEQEVGNLKKCLAAGFAEVFMICAEGKTLGGLKKAAEGKVDAKALANLKFLSPEELLASTELLDGVRKEQTVRGYKVKVHLKPMDGQEAEARRRAVGQVMMRGRGK